ncbi:MAG TPA: NAD(P)H-binding protein [Casimicrobiaceae bacterium]|nr:NAD(P)H-binding protein [Casimicrobiaceae bacterium]
MQPSAVRLNDNVVTPARSALLAGATGLVGRALLSSLLASDRYHGVHVLVRRTSPHIDAAPRLKILEVDFTRLPAAFPPVDDVFIALGTTIKIAGSEEAFRRVDLDFVVNVGRAARAAGATRLGVVSAVGADPTSRIFYNRVKGEMEIAVMQLGYESVVIAQPSMLLGDRAALGQPARSSELWAARLLAPVGRLLPKDLRPIPARAVASALLAAVLASQPGVRVLKSGAMQEYA